MARLVAGTVQRPAVGTLLHLPAAAHPPGQPTVEVGVEVLNGAGLEHLAHLLAWGIERGMTVRDALALPFYHPTLEEGLRTAFRDLAKHLDLLGACRCEDLADCPGG